MNHFTLLVDACSAAKCFAGRQEGRDNRREGMGYFFLLCSIGTLPEDRGPNLLYWLQTLQTGIGESKTLLPFQHQDKKNITCSTHKHTFSEKDMWWSELQNCWFRLQNILDIFIQIKSTAALREPSMSAQSYIKPLNKMECLVRAS